MGSQGPRGREKPKFGQAEGNIKATLVNSRYVLNVVEPWICVHTGIPYEAKSSLKADSMYNLFIIEDPVPSKILGTLYAFSLHLSC